MKNLVIASTLFLIISCSDKSQNLVSVSEQNKNVISNVESKSSSRYSEGSSLIDAIYFEMIKDEEQLKILEADINTMKKKSEGLIKQKQEILDKPTQYYDEAEMNIKSISDSILKKEMQNFIKESLENFKKNKEELRLVVSEIQRNNRKITEYYNAFKIKKTLPEIEKYQKQNPLNLENLNKLISEQKQLLVKLKSLK